MQFTLVGLGRLGMCDWFISKIKAGNTCRNIKYNNLKLHLFIESKIDDNRFTVFFGIFALLSIAKGL